MRMQLKRACFSALAVAATLTAFAAATRAQNSPAWQVYFSPKGGCTEAIVRAVRTAQRTILVEAYDLTSTPIADALVDAKRRGIDVDVIIDPYLGRRAPRALRAVAQAGIPILVDQQHRMNHNKVMVIDSSTVITGSFNFTFAAENDHAENLLVIHDQALAKKYTQNWRLHAGHSAPYRLR